MGGGNRGGRPFYSTSSYGGRQLTEYAEEGSQQTGLKRVFISFHVDDEKYVNLLRVQAKDENSPLEFVDYSVKEPFDEAWKTQCTERIKQSSVVLVAIGEETHTREAVLWEINKAYELGKPFIGVRIHGEKNHAIPQPLIDNNAPIVNWRLAELQASIEKTEPADPET